MDELLTRYITHDIVCSMYRTVNISETTYQELHKIATQLNKPKAQVVESLVKHYGETIRDKDSVKLEKFNKEMGAKVKSLKFSRKIVFSTKNMDKDFASLAHTDYYP